ncbi:MAG: flagellar biosynthetic protein FliO [Rickettsiales bacterium]|nr:flagellar biosynthetic protein FliO [Rickettsiales bacterium]
MTISQILNSSLALIFVLCLIGIVSVLLRKYLLKENYLGKNSDKRLSVSESLMLDQKRKLVLVKRDEKEHLILVSTDDNIIIEKDIIKEDTKENN